MADGLDTNLPGGMYAIPSIPAPTSMSNLGQGLSTLQQQLSQTMLQQEQDRKTKLKEKFNYSKELNDADGMITTAKEMYGSLTPQQEAMIRQHAQQQNLLSASKGFEESKFLPVPARYEYLSQLGYGQFLPKTQTPLQGPTRPGEVLVKETPDLEAFQKQLSDAGLLGKSTTTGMGLGLTGFDPLIDNITQPLKADNESIIAARSGYNFQPSDEAAIRRWEQIVARRRLLADRVNYALANSKITGDMAPLQAALQDVQATDEEFSQARKTFYDSLTPGVRQAVAESQNAYRTVQGNVAQQRADANDRLVQLRRDQLLQNREIAVNNFALRTANLALQTGRLNADQSKAYYARILSLYNSRLARENRLATAYLRSPEELEQIEARAMAEAKAEADREFPAAAAVPAPMIEWQSLGGGLSSAPASTSAPATANLDRAGLSEKLRVLGVNEAYLNNLSRKYNVPVDEILAVIQQESGGDPNATSRTGARGLMQLMPNTFGGLGVRGDITNPRANVEAGVKYLAEMHKRFPNQLEAIGHYNAGPGGNLANTETQGYMRNIGGMLGLSAAPAATSSAPTRGLETATGSVRATGAGRSALQGNMGTRPAQSRATPAGAQALRMGAR